MTKTKIEWADEVWNPVTGCTKVSAGCKNCYAERIAKRFWRDGITGDNYRLFSEVRCHSERLEQPLLWKRSRRVFVDSMSDLFHKDVPEGFIDAVFNIMEQAFWHKFIILTKRPERMLTYMLHLATYLNIKDVWPNVWLGISVEDQKTANERIPILLQTPSALRFVSVEPMLKPIYLGDFLCRDYINKKLTLGNYLDWVICGCESGPGARPMKMSWAADLKHQCVFSDVPFFFKQAMIKGKLVKMPELHGKVWDEIPKIH